MDVIDNVLKYLPYAAAREIGERCNKHLITDIRIRAGKRISAVWQGGEMQAGEILLKEDISLIVSAMLRHSPYAYEDELRMGYFTLSGGVRAGVSGRFSGGGMNINDISSVCLRIAREVKGCARKLKESVSENGCVYSSVILGPPGSGKTTIIRDLARLLSDEGRQVAIADERGEIAAVKSCVPQMDVGLRTDVSEGGDKAGAMRRLIRSMAPDVIVTDEIGGEDDARAILEAAQMGVSVIATAHASSLSGALFRRGLADILSSGVFQRAAVLTKPPGEIRNIHIWTNKEGGRWL